MTVTACALVAAAFAVAVPAHAQVEVPDVQVPEIPAPVPQVPVPDVPVPQVPAPSVPGAPAPSLPHLPGGTGGLPSAPGGTPQIPGGSAPGSPDRWSLSSAGSAGATGAPRATGSGGSSAADGGRAHSSQAGGNGNRRRRPGIEGTRYRTPNKLVSGLRGCIDEIPRLQRVVLVLRYGIGSIDARSRRGTAETLGASKRWVARVERRGVRSLARTSRSSRCEGSGVRQSALADVLELIFAGFVGDVFGTTAGLLAPGMLTPASDGRLVAAPAGGDGEATAVKGVRESGPGKDDPNGDAPDASAFGAPFADLDSSSNTLLSLLLLAAVICSGVFLVRRFSRSLR